MIQIIKNDIRDFLKLNRRDIVSNYCDVDSDNKISWKNYKSIDYKTFYPVYYQNVIDKYQYSILFQNGDIYRFYYKFSDDIIDEMSLQYLPCPNEFFSDISRDMQDIEDKLTDCILKKKNYIDNNYIRVEYGTATDHIHSHLHLGSNKTIRIPAQMVVTPNIFYEFILTITDSCIHKNIIRTNHIQLNNTKMKNFYKTIIEDHNSKKIRYSIRRRS